MQMLFAPLSVKRFHLADQIVHFVNLACWAALAFSGIAIGAAARAGVRPERLDVSIHFIAGFALIAALLGWLVFAPDRARRLAHEILRGDRPFWDWFKNLGGYPAKLFKSLRLTSAAPHTTPQGRYNAGQRAAYGLLVLLNVVLLASGATLFMLHQPMDQSAFYACVLKIHGLAFELSVLILLVHIPMGLCSMRYLKAIFPGSNGCIPATEATKHPPLWVREDLEPHPNKPELLVERRLD